MATSYVQFVPEKRGPNAQRTREFDKIAQSEISSLICTNSFIDQNLFKMCHR